MTLKICVSFAVEYIYSVFGHTFTLKQNKGLNVTHFKRRVTLGRWPFIDNSHGYLIFQDFKVFLDTISPQMNTTSGIQTNSFFIGASWAPKY